MKVHSEPQKHMVLGSIFFKQFLKMLYWSMVDCSSFPGGASGKEPACPCRRHKRFGFDPWAGKILWKREWQPTPVFLPGEFH